MRILLVTTWYPSLLAPNSGIFVLDAVEAISREHDVQVVHLMAPQHMHADEPDVGPVPVRRIPMATGNPVHVLRARRLLQPSITWADLVHTQAFSAMLPFAIRRPDRPWVHTEHWSGVPRPETVGRVWRASAPTALRLFRRPDTVTAVSQYLGGAIQRARRAPVRVVPCVIEPVAELVERPAPTGVVRLVGVGGLVDGKDPICAVETVAELRRRGVDVVLEWAGEGPLRPAVEQRVHELRLEGRVTLPGVVSKRAVGAMLDGADVFLLPTRGETFSAATAEAVVHGRPVVVGAVGGQREYLTDESGAMVATQTPIAYADAVETMLERTRGTTAAAIAATVGDRFSARSVLGGYDDAYAEAMSA